MLLIVISIDQSVLDPSSPFPSAEGESFLGAVIVWQPGPALFIAAVHVCHNIKLLWAKKP